MPQLDSELREKREAIVITAFPDFKFDPQSNRMVCERTYFDLGTILRQLGVARDSNSLGGRMGTIVNHPLVVGRALFRQLTGI